MLDSPEAGVTGSYEPSLQHLHTFVKIHNLVMFSAERALCVSDEYNLSTSLQAYTFLKGPCPLPLEEMAHS